MRLSKKSLYALRALRHLADNFGKQPISVARLCELEGFSVKYLEQVMSQLRKSGFVISERGKEGGYSLRIKPEKVKLGDIIRAIDGPFALIPCSNKTAPYFDCELKNRGSACWLRNLMIRVRDSISEVLDNETLADLSKNAQSTTGSMCR